MRTKQELHITLQSVIIVFSVALLLFFAGCGSQDEPSSEKEDELQTSDTKIELNAEGWKSQVESRVDLFGSDDLKDEGTEENPKPGGNFTLSAYLDDGTSFLENKRVWYFKDDEEWRFRSGNALVDYYWPYYGTLNFFAYMPYSGYTAKKHYVTNIQCDGNGPSFECILPNSNEKDDNEIEFIYAYTDALDKESGPVVLNFTHPFAIINFKLAAGSYRMTINELQLTGISLQGKYEHNQPTKWSATDVATKAENIYTINVGEKRIPNDVNYNTVFAGPFLVIPQDCSSISWQMNLKRDENSENTNIGGALSGSWLPGYVYTYSIKHGEADEEIYFSVEVEPWTINAYKNVVEVE